jgi:hypothetical protein
MTPTTPTNLNEIEHGSVEISTGVSVVNDIDNDINSITDKLMNINLNSNVSNVNNIIKNKGIGAGGSKTNKNGLIYEDFTELKTEYNIISSDKHYKKINFKVNEDIVFITTKQSHLFKYMEDSLNKDIPKAHGCKNPDECYINENTKTIFILEKKFQQVQGSVCEKLQTGGFKRRHYKKSFPSYNVVYIYCLSDWFKEHCKAELQGLKDDNIPVFWGNNKNYKQDIISFMINYKI